MLTDKGWKRFDPEWVAGGPHDRERWVGEWIVYRRKMEEKSWRAIGDEMGMHWSTVQRIYKEVVGQDAYTGPLPEWVDPDHLCDICRHPLIGVDN